MRNIHYVLIAFLSIPFFKVYGQENPEIDRGPLFKNEQGRKTAKKELNTAENYYLEGAGAYEEALKHYLTTYNYYAESPELNYKIGVCYLWSSDKKSSLKYFLESSPEVAKDYYLLLGRSYQYNLMYDTAKVTYDKYLSSLGNLGRRNNADYITRLKNECDNGLAFYRDSLSAEIINLGPVINSYYDEYGADLWTDESALYFTSRQPVEFPETVNSRYDYDERILRAPKSLNERYEYLEELYKLYEGTNTSLAGMKPEENRIYYYQGEMHQGRLYTAVVEDGKWKKRKALKGGINHIAYKETSIDFDSLGNAYFVSDRKGGIGGKDIWISYVKSGNKYEKPINLGSTINTPEDEEGVHLSADGKTLYFSSKGHSGLGGYDVFRASKSSLGSWEKPVNMGHPINSPADELFYKTTADSLISIYSTIRSDSYGGLDIYKVQIDTRIPFHVEGTVVDNEMNLPLRATIKVFDKNTLELLQTSMADTLSGKYILAFEDTGHYSMQVDYAGYNSQFDDINNPGVKQDTITMNFSLAELKNPFTLIGRISDIDKGTPLMATLTFNLANYDSTVVGRTVSVDSTGKYSITFDDKYDMILHVDAVDYFSDVAPINTTNNTDKVISMDVGLKRSKIDYVMSGRLTNEANDEPVAGTIKYFHPGDDVPFATAPSDSISGKYSINLDSGGPYLVEINVSGYLFINEAFQFPVGETLTVKNYKLAKLETGLKFVMENILFNSGKATMQISSYEDINKLAELMLENPQVRIEVSGHTDDVGSAASNNKLSKARALTVKEYLVSRGVSGSNIEYEGYGFQQPIESNMTEEGRRKNRRVEVKILD